MGLLAFCPRGGLKDRVLLTNAAVVALIYWLPSVIAFVRRHRNRRAVLGLNTLAGWTVFGWLIALVWSIFPEPSSYPRSERCSPYPTPHLPGGSRG